MGLTQVGGESPASAAEKDGAVPASLGGQAAVLLGHEPLSGALRSLRRLLGSADTEHGVTFCLSPRYPPPRLHLRPPRHR